jgi:hypothetical protein
MPPPAAALQPFADDRRIQQRERENSRRRSAENAVEALGAG